MLPSYLLTLREGLEAALIVGIVLGTLRKMRRPELVPALWAGVVAAVVVSLGTAAVMVVIGFQLSGPAEEIFEGITMLLAASVLTWMIFWMYRNARNLTANLESDVRRAALGQKNGALFMVAFLAVVREGIELALFLTAVTFTSGARGTLVGAFLGLGTAVLLGWSLFSSLVRLDMRRFFRFTSILLILFAAGLVAHGVHELNEAGWLPSIVEHVWDINYILDESSFVGEILKTLFGYNGNPSLTEVLAYVGYYVAIFLGLRWRESGRSVKVAA